MRKRGRSARTGAPRHRLFLFALGLIVACAVVYEIAMVEGPAYFGDDSVYTYYANVAANGSFHEYATDIFSFRLLSIFPIAVFFKLFGISALSSAAWAITAFAGAIVITFCIGRELYNDYAGLLAALLMGFFPLMTVLAGTPSPNMVEALVTGLVMLSVIRAQRSRSWLWYFLCGIFVVAAPLTTPAGAIIIVVLAVYLAAELVMGRIRLDRTSAYLIYGLLAAGACLMAFNYGNAGRPFITITGTAAIYSTAGTAVEGILINTNPYFYFNTMFPYRIISVLGNAAHYGILNPLSIWSAIYSSNHNNVGFYFYAFVLSSLYLLARKEKRAYVPFVWFGVAFLYLEFGPIYFRLFPFEYIVTHRLWRYLTIVSVPTVLLISMGIVRFVHDNRRKARRYAALSASAAIVCLLVLSGLQISLYWHSVVKYQTYDQRSIANYITTLPDSTGIYYESGFADVLVYTGYDNMSRFHAYDSIRDCRGIPSNVYVIIPKYYSAFNLNYTPDPVQCPYWNLVLYPSYPDSVTSAVQAAGMPFQAKLYYTGNATAAAG
ncbi:MAG: glycosyltransferase family 39 protein [Candidatus Micrarchaeota archaeon]|nr:glycosyltransferase family 39 protein [Candidatus Micrarchaeota archaeon]